MPATRSRSTHPATLRRTARRAFAHAQSCMRAARIMQRCGGSEAYVLPYVKAARLATRNGRAFLRMAEGR